MWYKIHCLAIFYPDHPHEGDALGTARELAHIVERLPCEVCLGHAREYLRLTPPDFSDSGALQFWAYTFHNAVNARLGKPCPSYERYQDIYKFELSLKRRISGLDFVS